MSNRQIISIKLYFRSKILAQILSKLEHMSTVHLHPYEHIL